MHTDRLIQQLAADTAPVRRLPAPWRRAAIWFAIALPYVAAVILVHSESVSLIHSGLMPVDLSRMLVDRQFIIEELAILATAITAVLAAFYSVVPGTDRRILLIPLLPLTIWLVSLGAGCARDWIRLGAKGLMLRADWACLPPAMLIGIVPVLAIVIMLRRGAPLYPRTTLAVGTLAAAALGNFALRIYHVGDVSIVLLVWHFGAVVVLSLITGWIGRLVLNWKTAKLAASH